MSVTFTIHKNIEYCQKKGICREEVYDCQCIDCNNGVPKQDCMDCHGEGKVRFLVYPYELNMVNSNFKTFTSALGMENDYCGDIDPRKLEDLLCKLNPELAIRANKDEIVENAKVKSDDVELFHVHQVNVIDYGLDAEQINRYITILFDICEEAIKRNELIVWG